MKVEQRVKSAGAWTPTATTTLAAPQLALIFGAREALLDPQTWDELRAHYPGARLVACSTAGEIAGVRVTDDALVATALALEHGKVAVAAAAVEPDSQAIGAKLAAQLSPDGLRHVLIISEGLKVNGSALVAGLVAGLPAGVAVTGGLSGDGARFERTVVCLDGPAPTEQVIAIGLYGERLHVGYGSQGGWEPFGVERTITRATGNVLFELDGEPALDLYKRYLDTHAAGLPATGLLFPLTVRSGDGEPVVRTILAVDEAARSLTFAGDVPVGYRARLMRASLERLVDGACGAATVSVADAPCATSLALLVSCVGRKLVLGQRIEEEVEGVRDVVGAGAVIAGFYSYGEIAPFGAGGVATASLHNQTMTITTLSER
jgi:hypothetical protein